MGLLDYLVICTDCEAQNIIRVNSDTTTVYPDYSSDCFVVLETNANPIRETLNEKKLVVSFVDFDHVVTLDVYMDVKELSENKDQFEFDEERVSEIMKVVAGTHRAPGYLYDKEGNRNKIPGMAVEFEMGVPYKPYKPKTEESVEPTEEPVDNPTP
jgi:hypothetical protein